MTLGALAPPAASSARPDAVQRGLDALVRSDGLPAALASVQDVKGRVRTYKAGVGDLATGAKVPDDGQVRVGSTTKTFTAVVVLQLVQEGRLTLTDPLARWLPAFPNAAAITVDHLLQHTAGVFSANEDLEARAEPRSRAPVESIDIAARHGAMFCPGQFWRYSNTGYTMLGQIIEAVDGRPYHEAVLARVLARFPGTSLRALAPREEPADIAPLLPTSPDEPRMVPNWAYSAGSIVGSAGDMVTFWHALLTGKLLDARRTALLFERLYPMFDEATFYGRGVMLYVLPADAGSAVWLGHSGGAPGVKSIVAYSPADRAFLAVALTGDGNAQAAAFLLLRGAGAR
jgi:D-alanyl-D-alanine carboxypeptidase